ncbi:MAG: malonate decarboxylase subunit alpha, partial [Terriglobia bacterium]
NPFNGHNVLVVRSQAPAVALVHAQRADREGNLWIEDPVTDELVMRASRRVIVTAEEIVERLPRATVAGAWVDCVAHTPGGAWPTACAGCYAEDERHLERYLQLARAGQFRNYLRQHVGTRERRPRFVQ